MGVEELWLSYTTVGSLSVPWKMSVDVYNQVKSDEVHTPFCSVSVKNVAASTCDSDIGSLDLEKRAGPRFIFPGGGALKDDLVKRLELAACYFSSNHLHEIQKRDRSSREWFQMERSWH